MAYLADVMVNTADVDNPFPGEMTTQPRLARDVLAVAGFRLEADTMAVAEFFAGQVRPEGVIYAHPGVQAMRPLRDRRHRLRCPA